MRLADIAGQIGARVHGDGDVRIRGVATLEDAGEGDLGFLANDKYSRQLAQTRASAVIVAQRHAENCPVSALVLDNPYLGYARAAALLYPEPEAVAGVHPTAVVDASAKVDPSAQIGPLCTVGAHSVIGPGAVLGPGCTLGDRVRVGEGTRLIARVTLWNDTQVGARCLLQPGAVLGGDGFGMANDQGNWVRVPQLGRVVVGDDVDIGANTTIDRGSLRDTVIENGAKLDNLIMIAHNVQIGAHTAIAACSGIAGSTTVGRHCTLGGATGLAGHLEIGDGVHFSGMSLVTRSFKEAGSYSGNLPAVPTSAWRRMVGRLRHLDELFQRVKRLEKELQAKGRRSDTDNPDD